jgi:hypothetical protein
VFLVVSGRTDTTDFGQGSGVGTRQRGSYPSLAVRPKLLATAGEGAPREKPRPADIVCFDRYRLLGLFVSGVDAFQSTVVRGRWSLACSYPSILPHLLRSVQLRTTVLPLRRKANDLGIFRLNRILLE